MHYEFKPPQAPGKLKIILVVIAVIAILFAAFVGVYSYFIEIAEIGPEFISVAITNFIATVSTALVLFILGVLITYSWCRWLRRNISSVTLDSSVFEKKLILFAICTGAGILTAIIGTKGISENILPALNYVPMGKTDPIFGADISYYMLVRPLLMNIQSMLSTLFWGMLILAVVSYYFYIFRQTGDFSLKSLLQEKKVVFHVFINIALIFLIKIIGYRFTMENILFGGNERVGGGYTEITIWLNFYRVIPFVLLGIIIIAFIFLNKSKYKAMLITIAVYPLSFILIAASSGIVQQLIVKPNEGAIESKYIGYNIQATRDAYNLSDADEMEYAVSDTLNAELIEQNREIVDNIRITDHEATLTAYNQLQGIRNYYQFIDADVVPYTEDGARKASFMAVRELSQEGDLEDATYVNKKMKYTHGYGIVKSPVNKVTLEGQPDFMIKNIPLSYYGTERDVTQPRIYFGEASNEYHIVNTKQSELDFADGSVEKEYNYDGDAGIKLTPFNRFVYALKNTDLNLITSGYINSDSRLLMNHNVLDRVRKVAPFISFDKDIHIAVDGDGTLKWIIDGYTKSSYYPYSQYNGNSFNYIRNSVKAVVDAYSGEVTLYIIDNDDPIIQSYAKIYPKIFSKKPMSEALKQQIKYPEWLFSVQAKIFTKYHVTNPATFYAGSDIWAIAREKYGENAEIKDVAPYYNITSLGDGKPEFVIMLPYTLKNKDNNLVGWLGARTDGDNYGKFVSYSFPVGKHVYGTLQIENKIDNDPTISKEITLWSQGGSSVMRGNLLVIPIKNSIVYVEPLYITSQNEASLPEVKRIIVSYGDEIVMESSLDKAFDKLFAKTAPEDTPDTPDTPADVPTEGNEPTTPAPETPADVPVSTDETLEQIREEYALMKQAAADGNWEEFGKSMDKIDSLLN